MSGLHPHQVRQVRLLLIPLGLVFLCVGIWFSADSLSSTTQQRDSAAWQTAQGRIVRSRQTDANVGDVQVCLKPQVEYEYQVDSRQFRSRRIDFSKMLSCDRDYTKKTLSKYPMNQIVSVFYDPSAPEQAVLEKKGLEGAYWGVALGLAFAFMGGVLVYVLLFKLSPSLRT